MYSIGDMRRLRGTGPSRGQVFRNGLDARIVEEPRIVSFALNTSGWVGILLVLKEGPTGRAMKRHIGVLIALAAATVARGSNGSTSTPTATSETTAPSPTERILMHRITLLLGCVAACMLILSPAAFAANPEVNHFADSGTFADPDFCGTGQTVEGSFEFHGTEFLAPNRPVDYWSVSESTIVFTNPENGSTVIAHAAGQFRITLIAGDPEGLHTFEATSIGLPEQIRKEHGGLLLRDAGYIVFHNTFDGDEFISSEIVIDRGPHPEAESDFELSCEVVPAALGIE
jgi:hypothetical protein